jgi:hypothetical protein
MCFRDRVPVIREPDNILMSTLFAVHDFIIPHREIIARFRIFCTSELTGMRSEEGAYTSIGLISNGESTFLLRFDTVSPRNTQELRCTSME